MVHIIHVVILVVHEMNTKCIERFDRLIRILDLRAGVCFGSQAVDAEEGALIIFVDIHSMKSTTARLEERGVT